MYYISKDINVDCVSYIYLITEWQIKISLMVLRQALDIFQNVLEKISEGKGSSPWRSLQQDKGK